MEIPFQEGQNRLMAGTAVMAGAAAASSRFGRRGHEFRPALEAEGGDFLVHFAALALGTLDFGFIVEDDLLKVLVALGTAVFKNRHSRSPLLKSISATEVTEITEQTEWNDEILECWVFVVRSPPHYSIIPLFQYSIFLIITKRWGGRQLLIPSRMQ
jgi:hypothetical protein